MELMPLNTSSASTRFFWSNMDAERQNVKRIWLVPFRLSCSASGGHNTPWLTEYLAELARLFTRVFEIELQFWNMPRDKSK